MSRVSSIFTVTAINDGVTVTANMNVSQTLAQIKNGSSYSPDWSSNEVLRPHLTIEAFKNGVKCAVSEGHWFFNGSEIQAGNTSFNIVRSVTSGNNQPELVIVDNPNTDGNDDIISFRGKVALDQSSVEFEVSRLLKITETASSGYGGIIMACNSSGNFTGDFGASLSSEYSTVYLKGMLYRGSDLQTGYDMIWYKNGVPVNSVGVEQTGTPTKTRSILTLDRDHVDDNAAIMCEFYLDDEKVAVAFVNVDDTLDDFEMFLGSEIVTDNNVQGSSSVSAESAMQVRSGQTARMFAWMGGVPSGAEFPDPDNPQSGWTFYARVYKPDMSEYKTYAFGATYNSSDSVKAYEITKQALPQDSSFSSKLVKNGNTIPHGRMDFSYEALMDLGKQLSVMVIATKQ